MSGNSRISVDWRVLRRDQIYDFSKARVVPYMLFPLDWEDEICAGISRSVLQSLTYAINIFRF